MGDAAPIRPGARVGLGRCRGVVLRVQSPPRMLRVHGRADHPGLYLVRWDGGGEHWYLAEHLTVDEPAPRALDRVRKALRRLRPRGSRGRAPGTSTP